MSPKHNSFTFTDSALFSLRTVYVRFGGKGKVKGKVKGKGKGKVKGKGKGKGKSKVFP